MACKQTLIFVVLVFTSCLWAREKDVKLSEIKSFKVCGRSFKLEIAKNDADRSRGMMFRKNLPADEGMLFVFDAPEAQVFWMKNVPIALDILFFDASAKLINSTTMKAESPLVQDTFLKRYPSDRPSQFVVELRDGTLKTFSKDELRNCKLEPRPNSPAARI